MTEYDQAPVSGGAVPVTDASPPLTANCAEEEFLRAAPAIVPLEDAYMRAAIPLATLLLARAIESAFASLGYWRLRLLTYFVIYAEHPVGELDELSRTPLNTCWRRCMRGSTSAIKISSMKPLGPAGD